MNTLLQTNPPEYTDAAEQCLTARNSFFGDSTCLTNYLTLSKRSTAGAVNNAATAICSSQRCKNRMSSYTSFLTACQVDYFLDGNHVCTYFKCIILVISEKNNFAYTVYGKTFEWENFHGCAQNTAFTGKLSQCIRLWPSCTVHSK